MISRLRRKFIITAMLSVTLVLGILIGLINFFNFRNVIENADSVLDLLITNGGEFPDMMPRRGGGQDPGNGNMMGGRDGQMSPEMKYEARYFSIVLDSEGNTLSVDTGRIAAIGSSEAEELAKMVFAGGREKGFAGGYRYRMSGKDNEVLVIFYDCGRRLDDARSFLGISVVISVIGLLIVFVLIAISSKAIIRPAAEAYEKQKRFITDAGHELKTPLAVINADCDVLEMETGDDNEWITDIRKQTKRLTDLTGQLIYLAKTEEGARSDLVKISFPLSDVVEEETESFKGPAKSSGKILETDIAPGISYNGDQKAIAQLVTILLDNAVKYSPEGGKINASLSKSGSKIIFSVSNDTSDPVSDEEMKRMFDRFYRTDRSRNSETGGYGIGLSIAKGITESHGGVIYATGKGNRITVTAEL